MSDSSGIRGSKRLVSLPPCLDNKAVCRVAGYAAKLQRELKKLKFQLNFTASVVIPLDRRKAVRTLCRGR